MDSPTRSGEDSLQKQTVFCVSTWRGLRRSEGRLLVRSAPYSDASRVTERTARHEVAEIDTP
ncbi:MAG: hypothetical protein LBI43_02510 [Streptococcaceae bacterium]|nr:hypothetical protein [Streptococcaceae bacterium]